jgi:4-hydroxybenzoate polyprenyltransferase
VAVTTFSVLLGVTAGDSPGTTALLAVAVLTGQLSIGWSNDRIDADRDRRAGRADKPVAGGELRSRAIEVAIGSAAVLTIGFSLALGWRAGVLHLAAVACGWAYNLCFKGTWLSWLPYAAAFGALPAVATLALPHPAGPGAWVVATGALLGVAAHLTNTLPDLVDDLATGVRGLPHRIGPHASLGLTLALVMAAICCAVYGPPGPVLAIGWVALILGIGLSAGGVAAVWRRPDSRLSFYAIIGIVGLDLVLVLLAGHHLR